MRLCSVTLKNFRGYRDLITIPIDSLTAIVGRNDSGKSTILEALDIFFAGGIAKIDQLDKHVDADSAEVYIACCFDDLPSEVTLDEQSSTMLLEESLLNERGQLEIVRIFDCSKTKPTHTTWLRAEYPEAEPFSLLHQKKNVELKKLVAQYGVADSVNLNDNASMRRALLALPEAESRTERLIRIDEKEAKQIGDALDRLMPIWALFQADRGSKVDDPEVQDPMKLAIKRAIDGVQSELDAVKAKVEAEALELSLGTVEQRKALHPELADAITPRFKADPQWAGLFKIDLDDDRGIPLNKRGSGVRRLILLSFVRAEVERRRGEASGSQRPLLLAIEEPETGQHPSSQRLVLEALQDLAEAGDQVLITTHSPSLAGLLPMSALRFVDKDPGLGAPRIRWGGEEVLQEIVVSLGLLPQAAIGGAKVVLVVEGPTDELALIAMSKVLKYAGHITFTLEDPCPGVFVVIGGGETLSQWVARDHLSKLGIPQVHIYDSDRTAADAAPKTTTAERAEKVSHMEGCICFVTRKRELENYLHLAVVATVTEPPLTLALSADEADYSDIAELIFTKVFAEVYAGKVELTLGLSGPDGKPIRLKKRKAKEFVSYLLMPRLSAEQLLERGKYLSEEGTEGNEVLEWFAALAPYLAPAFSPKVVGKTGATG